MIFGASNVVCHVFDSDWMHIVFFDEGNAALGQRGHIGRENIWNLVGFNQKMEEIAEGGVDKPLAGAKGADLIGEIFQKREVELIHLQVMEREGFQRVFK